MILRYSLPGGKEKIVELGQKTTLTIGRGSAADVLIADKMASRIHCEISYKDGACFIRDCDSRNGTFVNGRSVKACRINVGDRIQVGDAVLIVETSPHIGTTTVVRELKDEMAKGKGYHTLLHEIIGDEKETRAQPRQKSDQ